MASEREEIKALIDRLQEPGSSSFGPEPGKMTREIANDLRELGWKILRYGQRERANYFRADMRAGRALPGSELVDDDAREGLMEAWDALDAIGASKPEHVPNHRRVFHASLEKAGMAGSDPRHREDAELPRHLRPMTEEHLARRAADVEERRRIVAERDGAMGRVAAAEERAARAENDVRLRKLEALRGILDTSPIPVLGEGATILGL